jgi:hypothetical protein
MPAIDVPRCLPSTFRVALSPGTAFPFIAFFTLTFTALEFLLITLFILTFILSAS